MAVFSYTGTLPAFRQDIESAQLRNRYTDILNYLTTENPSGVIWDSTAGGAQYQAFLLDADLENTTLSHVLRSNVALDITGAGATNEFVYVTSPGTYGSSRS